MDQREPTVTAVDPASRETRSQISSAIRLWIVRWLVFFLICLGLGYAALARYDPRLTLGLSDSAIYYRLVAGEEVQAREQRFRVLVPYLAKPAYALTRKFMDPEVAARLSLLISNSIFCATTACLLVAIGLRVTNNMAVSMLAAALYLLNFAIAHLQLSGMVDTGEACLLLAVTATLFSKRWWLLPVWGLLGTLAKETFVPLAAVLTLAWWLLESRERARRSSRTLPIIAMLVVALASMIVLRWAIAGTIGISEIFSLTNAGGNQSGLAGAMFSPTFWYVFIWALPLGLPRIHRLPRAWVLATVAGTLTALALGLYRDIGGNVARPMFDVIGPMLCLSSAMFLAGHPDRTENGCDRKQQLTDGFQETDEIRSKESGAHRSKPARPLGRRH
jgi:hypothetical protein